MYPYRYESLLERKASRISIAVKATYMEAYQYSYMYLICYFSARMDRRPLRNGAPDGDRPHESDAPGRGFPQPGLTRASPSSGGESHFLNNTAISPTMPRRNASTQMTKIVPVITITHSPMFAP